MRNEDFKHILMKNTSFLFLLFVIPFMVMGQNSTMSRDKTDNPVKVNFNLEKGKVLIIPFESKMYLSDIDKRLGPANNMSHDELGAKFRSALDQNMFLSLEKSGAKALSFYAMEGVKDSEKKDLSYIYSSIGYDYEVLPEEDEEAVNTKPLHKKLSGKLFGNKSRKEETGTRVENGQIKNSQDKREKYMKAVISNTNMLNTLQKSYGTGYFVFLSQLDLKRSASGTHDLADETYQRMMKVHYTVYDLDGKVLSSGAKKAYFSSKMDDVEKIITTQLPVLCDSIVSTFATNEKMESENNGNMQKQ